MTLAAHRSQVALEFVDAESGKVAALLGLAHSRLTPIAREILRADARLEGRGFVAVCHSSWRLDRPVAQYNDDAVRIISLVTLAWRRIRVWCTFWLGRIGMDIGQTLVPGLGCIEGDLLMVVDSPNFVSVGFCTTLPVTLLPRERYAVDPVHRTRVRLRRGFTVLEMVVVMLVISILIMLLLPAVQSSRELARRTSCANSLMQIGVATHGYSNAFGQLPMPLGGSDGSSEVGADNDGRLSFIVPLLSFLDQRVLAERIAAAGGGGMDRPGERSSLTMDGDELHGMGMEAMDDDSDGMDMEMFAEETIEVLPPDDSPVGGREPWSTYYYPWKVDVPVLRCPSDPANEQPFGATNYAACLGDGIVGSGSGPFVDVDGRLQFDALLKNQVDASMRGTFVPRTVTRLAEIKDGLAQTLMLAEISVDLGDRSIKTIAALGPGIDSLRDRPIWAFREGLVDSERPQFWGENTSLVSAGQQKPIARGGRWADGAPMFTSFHTILPPNRECTLAYDREDSAGILPPSSRHQGGVNVCFADGSVTFVTDFIDSGDLSQPTVYVGSERPPGSTSPYGVWGAMGTRASRDLASIGFAGGVAN